MWRQPIEPQTSRMTPTFLLLLLVLFLYRLLASLPPRLHRILCGRTLPFFVQHPILYLLSFGTVPTPAPLPHYHLLVVLGSGGHTAEMLTFLSNVHHPHLKSVAFFLAKTDQHSQLKAEGWVNSRTQRHPDLKVTFHAITRSREVGQSWWSTLFTTLLGLFETMYHYWSITPDVILCNGPGTCLPIVYCGMVCKILGIRSRTRLVFVESFARVQSLSLTGVLVYPVVDRFVVQWNQLQQKWPRGTEYIGKIF